jgi:hypothetical protein
LVRKLYSTISGFGATVNIFENGVDFLYSIKVLEYIDQPIRYIAPKKSEASHQKRMLLVINLLPLMVTSLEEQRTKKTLKYENKKKLIYVK